MQGHQIPLSDDFELGYSGIASYTLGCGTISGLRSKAQSRVRGHSVI